MHTPTLAVNINIKYQVVKGVVRFTEVNLFFEGMLIYITYVALLTHCQVCGEPGSRIHISIYTNVSPASKLRQNAAIVVSFDFTLFAIEDVQPTPITGDPD
jgi:hypothetical protein